MLTGTVKQAVRILDTIHYVREPRDRADQGQFARCYIGGVEPVLACAACVFMDIQRSVGLEGQSGAEDRRPGVGEGGHKRGVSTCRIDGVQAGAVHTVQDAVRRRFQPCIFIERLPDDRQSTRGEIVRVKLMAGINHTEIQDVDAGIPHGSDLCP